MKFIADSMLGRLARWLRLLGYDTLYFPRIQDSLLLEIAREQERVLLTRDTRLVKARGLGNFLLLHDNDTFKQLRMVVERFGLTTQAGMNGTLHSRCSLCNTLPVPVPKELAKDHLPEYVYQTTESFRQCPECRRVYWNGTHRERFREKLKEVLGQ